ncbi:MAG TPA: pitrilysin family protein [Clostridia bacterium]|nr:pitrilysin family protein [Clostridia bacterium]
MANTIDAEKAVKISSVNGIEVYRINTEKFKTSSIHFFFQDNLTRESVTLNSLLPAVMRRGSERYPTLGDISKQMENLYGATFDCGVTKKGERHIMQFYVEFLSKRYIPDSVDSFKEGLELLYDIIMKPALENGRFREDYLEQEKDKLRILIEGRVNDKMSYSVDRCLEETCKDEPYGIYDYGFVEDLPGINSEALTNHYRKMLETYPLQVYLAGDISDGDTKEVLDRLSGLKRGNMLQLGSGFIEKQPDKPRYVTEPMNVTQGKLCLGFRTNISPQSPAYTSLMVYNGVLGGGIHSKLFQNVREKASLAYYSKSMLEKFKGLMVISSGIEAKNKDKALDIILKQLEAIKSGEISDYELGATVKSMETSLKSLGDSQLNLVDFYLSQTVSGTWDNLTDIIDKIKQVTKEQIIDSARNIKLDTVYFLTSQQDGSGNGQEETGNENR